MLFILLSFKIALCDGKKTMTFDCLIISCNYPLPVTLLLSDEMPNYQQHSINWQPNSMYFVFLKSLLV